MLKLLLGNKQFYRQKQSSQLIANFYKESLFRNHKYSNESDLFLQINNIVLEQ